MTPEEVADLRRLAEAATPWPWWLNGGEPWAGDEAMTRDLDARAGFEEGEPTADEWDAWAETTGSLFHGDVRRPEDAALIVAAVNALPALLDDFEARLAARDAEVAELRVSLRSTQEHALAEHNRASNLARQVSAARALADEWRAWRLRVCRACRDKEFARVNSHDCGRRTLDAETDLRAILAPTADPAAEGATDG